jgi:hypothetical protein
MTSSWNAIIMDLDGEPALRFSLGMLCLIHAGGQ